MEIVEVLKKSEVFHDLSDEQLRIVEKLCSEQKFEAGTVICKQDEKSDKLYVIENGLVGIILEHGPLAQRQMQTATDFDVFAWSAMIKPYRYTATVKALKGTTTLAIVSSDLVKLCDSNHEIGYVVTFGIARVVAKRLHEAYMQLLGVTGC